MLTPPDHRLQDGHKMGVLYIRWDYGSDDTYPEFTVLININIVRRSVICNSCIETMRISCRGFYRERLRRHCLRTAFLTVFLSLLIEENIEYAVSLLSNSFGSSTHVADQHRSYQQPHRRGTADAVPRGGNIQQRVPFDNYFWSRSRGETPLQVADDDALPPPSPPKELPLRFLRAGKGDPAVGLRRYEATLAWRKQERIDGILRESFPSFALIKQNYPHYLHLRGRNGEPCFYEQPARTNLRALREGGVDLEQLLRHYMMITEFQWQYVERRDLATSIYIIDLAGIRMKDFFGETVDFVKKAAAVSAQHYPERAGCVFVINVPAWFKLIWQAVRPIIDEATLKKIYILRGAHEIRQNLLLRITLENIPPEYGGTSMPLGYSPEENELANLMSHNVGLAAQRRAVCKGCRSDTKTEHWACAFCRWTPARSY